MLTIRYAIENGESGNVEIDSGDKWSFGRTDAADPPSVATDDGRVSRNALVIRDSGPGPVVFRGQRGEAAKVLIVGPQGPVSSVPEGTATNLTSEARRVELWLGAEMILRAEVQFSDRGTVRERREAADAASDEDGA